MNRAEMDKLMSLPPSDRFEWTLKKFLQTKEIWALTNGELWAQGQDPEGRQFLPVWPYPELAVAGQGNNWQSYKPKAVSLSAWRERWIPGMHSAQKFISVFPVSGGGSILVSPERMRRNLDQFSLPINPLRDE